ncbi:hypothetical protein PRK78_000905 [Emydomyces testavorans]|uniref:GPI anchored cell wall protein n=1 Tax=Emydomyces testavorans TaxID=2070801 RepID=A0AAF0DCA0_9EURO|nr:hypothetical protein PRK78_000905 [Emydomyces testavorans]
MLSIRSAVVFAILALFEVVAAATPPGCLLAAVNTQKDPSDMKALCGSASKQVQNEITKVCNGPDVKNALDAYSKTCSESGNKVGLEEKSVSTYTVHFANRGSLLYTEIVSVSNTTLATVSATSSSTRSATASVGATATPTATGSGSGSGSSSSSSSSSGRAPTVTGNTASSIKSKSLAVAAIAAMVGAAAM